MSEENDLLTEMVALLYAVDGLPYEQIIDRLGTSRATVWRCLNKRGKHLYSEVRTPSESLRSREATIREAIDKRLSTTSESYKRLVQRLAVASEPNQPPNLRVFSSVKGAESLVTGEWDKAALAFGRSAAGDVRRLVSSAHTVGVSWGRTVCGLVAGLKELKVTSPWGLGGKPITFFPVRGEIQGDIDGEIPYDSFPDPTQLSSTSLATDLARMANGPAQKSLSLLSSAAIIPAPFKGGELAVIKKFISDNAHYGRIFGGKTASACGLRGGPKRKPLIEEMDLLLAAVGTPQHRMGLWGNWLSDYLDISYESISKIVVGDLGGVLIPRPNLSKAQNKLFESINERWMGISMEHVRACAAKKRDSRGNEQTGPGVVVLGVGRYRAEVIYECVRLGLANELMIDTDLAKALEAGPPFLTARD